ncbi:MAG: hypothetical protein EAS52_10575 [Parapedobacter sp.]|nr:MAG: hypothetical protein EAS52_10575 [Parapedobacter sp.]
MIFIVYDYNINYFLRVLTPVVIVVVIVVYFFINIKSFFAVAKLALVISPSLHWKSMQVSLV